MTSALSGTKSLTKRRVVTIGGWRPVSCDLLATFTFLYTKTPILPRLVSPLPLMIGRAFCGTPPRIHCAKSLTTVLTRHLTPTTTVFQRSYFAISLMTLTTPLPSLPLPVQIHLPRPHMPHFQSSLMRYRSTAKYLSQLPRKSSGRQQPKVAAFPPFHRVQSLKPPERRNLRRLVLLPTQTRRLLQLTLPLDKLHSVALLRTI